MWEPDATLGVDFSVRFELIQSGEVDDFGFESETMGGLRDFRFFVESFLRLAKHEEAFVDEWEIFLLSEFEVETSAEQAEVAQKFWGVLEVLLIGVAHEEPDPPGEGGVEAGSQKERALGIEHPLESLGNDPGSGEGDEMAGHNHAGVTAGA